MKVATNKVKHVVDFYHASLGDLFDAGEVSALINTAFEYYLGYKRDELIQQLEDNLNQSDLLNLYDCAKELREGKPLQYIINEAWFYDLKFFVNENVLIPRPETEELVDLILKKEEGCNSLLDIGTGSGCIPVSIKSQLTSCDVYACDISTGALEIAKKNAVINKVDVSFLEADILDPSMFKKKLEKKFDIIVSNPPYIKESEKGAMHKNVTAHEPHLALFVNDEDEIIFYKRIIEICEALLNAGGKLFFELNPITAEEVKQFAVKSNLFVSVQILSDMSGKARFLRAVRNS